MKADRASLVFALDNLLDNAIRHDDEGIARVLADNLRIDGFNVRWARTAHEALVESQAFRPDLVLLDIMLAGQPHGFEICRVLRQAGRCGVIVVSARGQREDKLRGLGAGADDYVTKPFDMEELAARRDRVVHRDELLREVWESWTDRRRARSISRWLGCVGRSSRTHRSRDTSAPSTATATR